MNLRLRSPSLFWTFAGAFLGVALLGTLLQGVVVLDVLRALSRRSLGLDSVVRKAADEVAAELARSPRADVSGILTAHQRTLDQAVIAFRDSTGHALFGANLPPRFGPHERREVEARPDGRDPLSAHAPPPDGFEFGDEMRGPEPGPPPGRPGGERRPPPDHRPEERPFGGDGDRPRHRPPPPSLAVSQKVLVAGRVVGEVVAWQLGPPRAPRISPTTRFLLSVPVALLLASVAGLMMFRTLLGRLRALQALAGRVAAGDLNVHVHEPGSDEIGQLGLALNRMTESLAAAKRVVEQSAHERRQLFADISHELATPLTSIRGYAETLLDSSMNLSRDERERYLQQIHGASQRMDLLIQDLLELTRLEVGATGLVRERIDWVALCRNTVEAFQARFQEAGLQLCWSESPPEAWIQADGLRMEQVIDNLLVNALHYVPPGGAIRVSILEIEGAASVYRLVVADDGPGFPADDLPHVFDRFYRGGNALSMAGSGLGLAIVQEIVRRHGGLVRAKNRQPSGACIEVDLPADVTRSV